MTLRLFIRESEEVGGKREEDPLVSRGLVEDGGAQVSAQPNSSATTTSNPGSSSSSVKIWSSSKVSTSDSER